MINIFIKHWSPTIDILFLCPRVTLVGVCYCLNMFKSIPSLGFGFCNLSQEQYFFHLLLSSSVWLTILAMNQGSFGGRVAIANTFKSHLSLSRKTFLIYLYANRIMLLFNLFSQIVLQNISGARGSIKPYLKKPFDLKL